MVENKAAKTTDIKPLEAKLCEIASFWNVIYLNPYFFHNIVPICY